MEFAICIDVDDVARAVDFYGRGLGLTVVEQHPEWAKVMSNEQTFWIMKTLSGPSGQISRDFRRHWTPVHLDFVVDDIDSVVQRALENGGQLDREIQRGERGDLANLSDPAGNGVDLFRPRK